ncbi:hypothetical protein N7461_001222 [Penicillium sp. DV-2018c]|nr:hypothetical protein N7461_001222 [Penicillium sp. DV-2018c]
MGFILTLTRRLQNKHFSRRLSTSSTRLNDEDANNLTKTISETSATRVISIETTSTIVHTQLQDPVTPSNRRAHLQTEDIDTRTLFDPSSAGVTPQPIQTSIHPARKASYPVLKLDMCHCSFQTPVLQGGQNNKEGELSASGYSCSCSCSPVKEGETGLPVDGVGVGEEVKKRNRRRSVADLLKRHCGLNIPRSSISLRSRGQVSPKWLDFGEGKGGGFG